jgi:hypothetical protein
MVKVPLHQDKNPLLGQTKSRVELTRASGSGPIASNQNAKTSHLLHFSSHRDRALALALDLEAEAFVESHNRVIGGGADGDGRGFRIGLDQLREKGGADSMSAMTTLNREGKTRHRLAGKNAQPNSPERPIGLGLVREKAVVPGPAPALDVTSKFRLPGKFVCARGLGLDRLQGLIEHLPENRFVFSGERSNQVIHWPYIIYL